MVQPHALQAVAVAASIQQKDKRHLDKVADVAILSRQKSVVMETLHQELQLCPRLLQRNLVQQTLDLVEAAAAFTPSITPQAQADQVLLHCVISLHQQLRFPWMQPWHRWQM
jgi:hypothetical protein